MNIKSNKGISLTSLIIAVIIMLIISGSLVFNNVEKLKINNLKKMYADIEILNTKVLEYYSNNKTLPILKEYTSDLSMISGIRNPNDNNKYFVIDIESMQNIRLNYGYGNDYSKIKNGQPLTNLKDVYIINQDSHTIYYVKGIEFENRNYYRENTEYEKVI